MAATTAFQQTQQLQPTTGAYAGEIRRFPVGVRTRREQISNVWIFAVFGLLVSTFLIYFHTVLLENQANHKQQEIIKLKEQNDAMLAQLAEIKTLPNVEQKALNLGMQPAESFRYITMTGAAASGLISLSSSSAVPARYPVQPPIGF